MRLLKEITRREGLNTQGKILCREAVRAIVVNEQKLLMIYSAKIGDYKFPGGGVDEGETHLQALAREIREECGASISEIGSAFGKIIEYDLPMEREYDEFKMTSFYYLCQVEASFQAQNLEHYEADLGFQPIWIDVEEALRANRSILSTVDHQSLHWVPRETFVLEQIKELLIQKDDYAR
jgi:8-oxo-dGTP pyrophosphatase MutT (NUDIX family)